MKKGKKIIVLLIAMILSIINIRVVKADTKNIEVTNIEVKEKSGTISVVDPVLESNEITSNITFNKVNDFVTFELTLKNNESEKYKITSIKDNNTNNNLKIEYSFNEDYINTNETNKVTIKLTYKNKLVNIEKVDLNNLKITLTLENEEGKSEEVIINPVTGDNILKFLILLIIAITGLIFSIKKIKYKGVKLGSILLVMALFVLPISIFASEKYEVNIKFTDIVIKGEYEKYNITINPNNGETPVTKAITYGDSIGELPESPSKEGYTFDKWVDSDGNTVTEDTVITCPIEIEAKYKVKEYTITYNLDGGTVSGNPDKYTIESNDITLKNPRKTGYTFTGWTGTGIDEKTTSVTIETGSTGNREYVANYSANTNTPYVVKHYKQKLSLDGYEIADTQNLAGTTDTSVTPAVNTYEGFTSPQTQTVTIKGDGSTVVTYNYDRIMYDFSTNNNEDVISSIEDGRYPYGTEVTLTAKDKAGYTFEKWSNDATSNPYTFILNSNLTIKPVYTFDGYKVTLNANGGSVNPTTITVNEGDTVGELPEPTPPTNKVFDGWYTDLTGGIEVTSTYVPNTDIEIFARYNNSTHTVSFDTDGGSTVASQTVNHGGVATRPTTDPTSAGKTFDDWYTDDTYTTKFDFDTAITEDTTIYAHFEELKVCANNENITRLSEDTCINNENIIVGDGIICKRATRLHQETCSRNDNSYYCSGAGYTEGGTKGTTTITYGNCGVNGTLSSGDAFTCDINSDGEFDELTERFYYVSDYYNTKTLEFENDTAVLIYYSNIYDGNICNVKSTIYSNEQMNNSGPLSMMEEYSKLSTWSTTLKYNSRQILSNRNTDFASGGYLPILDFSNLPARAITGQEVNSVCPIGYHDHNRGELDECIYLLENTSFSTSNVSNRGYWIETASSKYSKKYVWALNGVGRYGEYLDLNDAYLYMGTRPVIEVSKGKMSYGSYQYNAVTFNANGGSIEENHRSVLINSSVGTLPVPRKDNFAFGGWYTSLTDGIKIDEKYKPVSNVTIYAHWIQPTYTVSFNSNGGSSVENLSISAEEKVGELPVPKKTGYNFVAWYADENFENIVTNNTVPNANVTYYAKWDKILTCNTNRDVTIMSDAICEANQNIIVGDGIVCKRAEVLHQEKCYQTNSSYNCSGTGYTKNGNKKTDMITYGNCGTNGTLKSGDAFTCDVNGDGNFDELLERFYYVSDYYNTKNKSFESDTAVLIYYNDVYNGIPCNSEIYFYENNGVNYLGPTGITVHLPTKEQWNNVSLKNSSRAILSEYRTYHNRNSTANGTLPTAFSYSNYSSRFLTAQELMNACSMNQVGTKTYGELEKCIYLMENTQFSIDIIDSGGYWLETPHYSSAYREVWSVHGFYRAVIEHSANNGSKSARPVIEVLKSKISY